MPPHGADRSITTCRSCRRRKIRCDRSRPNCNRCRETGAACVYEDQIPQPPPTYQFVAEAPGLPAPRLSRTSSSHEGAGQTDLVSISSERLRSIENSVETLNLMVQRLQAQRSRGGSSTSTSNTSSPNIQEPAPEPTLTGHLSSQGGGRLRYVESTFWASMCNKVSELDELLGSQARYLLDSAAIPSDDDDDNDDDQQEDLIESEFEDDGTATQRRETSARSATAAVASHTRLVGDIVAQPPAWRQASKITTRTIARNPSFLQQLPPKPICDLLVDGYIDGYHPIVPLIHAPSFRQRYEDFWRTRDDPDASETASMAFTALLCAVTYAGSVTYPDRIAEMSEKAPRPEDVSTHLHRLGLKALRLANFPRTPTLDSFRAYLLCQSTWMREEEPLTCVAFVGLALRVATMLGLHRDPSHFPEVPPIEAEVRRRVWWQLVHIDVLVAIASGLPPMVELGSWDVQGISDLKEEYFGTPSGMRYEVAVRAGQQPPDTADDPRRPGRESMVSTSGILVAGKLRVSLVLRRTLARVFRSGLPTTSELIAMRSEFKMLGEDLVARIARIPEPHPLRTGETTAGSSYENNPALNRWARLLLSAFIDEKYCLVCHPHLKGQWMSRSDAVDWLSTLTYRPTSVGQVWEDLYPQAIARCQSFLTKCAQMASVEEYRHYQWSWPGNHQPLHAMMVLLVELNENPDSPSAPDSRRAIDIIFALNGPYGGLVAGMGTQGDTVRRPLTEGGRETWDYLRRLRTKAWQTAGLDPAVVWTREQAVRYCNVQDEPEVRSHSPDPESIWAATSSGVPDEPQTGPSNSTSADIVGDFMESPRNFDWAYITEVLASEQPMDLDFNFGLEDLGEGS